MVGRKPLNWTANTTPQQWQIEYKGRSTGTKWTTVTVNGTMRTVVLSSLRYNERYKWHIRAKCNGTWTAYSYEVEFKTLPRTNMLTMAEKGSALQEAEEDLVVPNLLNHSQYWRSPNLSAQELLKDLPQSIHCNS